MDRPGRPTEDLTTQADDLAHAYNQRWQHVFQAKTALDSELIEAEAIWGTALSAAEMELRRCIAELSVSLGTYLHALDRGGREAVPLEVLSTVEGGFSPIGVDDSEDAFASRIATAVREFERALRRHLGTAA